MNHVASARVRGNEQLRVHIDLVPELIN